MQTNLPAIGGLVSTDQIRMVLYQSGQLVHGPYGSLLQPLSATLTALAGIDSSSGFVDPWAFQPVGVPVPLFDHLDGIGLPPTDQAYRYVLLTAGEDGVGEYNEGILTAESISGSAPLVLATAVIDLAASPIDGQTIRLINTERRLLRAGSSGTIEADQMQQITGSMRSAATTGPVNSGGDVDGAFSRGTGRANGMSAVSNSANDLNFDSADSPGARAGDETRSKNIGATFCMRVL